MRRLAIVCLLTIGLLLPATARPVNAYVRVGVSVGFFYNELSPYGRWIDGPYGYAWVPVVAAGWQPYSNGEWIWTDHGWTWVSYDLWGGDPCHYGSWVWDDPWGWAWVPGTVWAPAWVSWCDSGDFIGWAPLPPTFAFSATGYFGSPVVLSRASYVFVPTNRFVGINVASARVPLSQNAVFLSRGRNLTAFRVSGGVVTNTALPVNRISTAIGRSVPRLSIAAARTDPRSLPAGTTGRMTLAASPQFVRAALAGKMVGAKAHAAVPSVPRGRPTDRRPMAASSRSRSLSSTGTATTVRRNQAPPRRPMLTHSSSAPRMGVGPAHMTSRAVGPASSEHSWTPHASVRPAVQTAPRPVARTQYSNAGRSERQAARPQTVIRTVAAPAARPAQSPPARATARRAAQPPQPAASRAQDKRRPPTAA
jgi:hypothetical protein